MNELQLLCLQQIKEVEKVIQLAKRDITDAPDGILRVILNHNCPQYYRRDDKNDVRGKYIKKSDRQLAKDLAQKDYAKKLISLAEKKKNEWKQCINYLDTKVLEEVYHELSSERKSMVVPYFLDEQLYFDEWMKNMKTTKLQYGKDDLLGIDSDSMIHTEQGEIVRSKSEKILADKLYLMGIPYVYEAPLHLHGFGYIRPDFTVLNKRTRTTFYWEHLGMMDDSVYCEKAIKKIESYTRSGIFPGKNLLLTYETKTHPLNIKTVEKMIEEYLT